MEIEKYLTRGIAENAISILALYRDSVVFGSYDNAKKEVSNLLEVRDDALSLVTHGFAIDKNLVSIIDKKVEELENSLNKIMENKK